MKQENNEGGFILATSLAALVLLLSLGVGVMGLASQSAKAEARRYWLTSANWYANAGTEYAMWQNTTTDIGSDGEGGTPADDWGTSGDVTLPPLGGQTITVHVDVDVNEATGKPTVRRAQADADFRTRTGVARAVYDTSTTSSDVPFAMASNGPMRLNGAAVDVYDPNVALNANVFSNGDITITGQPNVAGFVTMAGDLITDDPVAARANLDPVSNPGSTDTILAGLPAYDFSVIENDINAEVNKVPGGLRAEAQAGRTQYVNGSLSINGSRRQQTINLNGGVLFVNGDLTITGQVDIQGEGTIVANNIFIAGTTNIGYSGSQATSPYRFIALNNFDANVRGNSTLKGQIISLGGFDLRGNMTLIGSVLATGAISSGGGGNMTLLYVPNNRELSTAQPGLHRISYQGRQASEDW